MAQVQLWPTQLWPTQSWPIQLWPIQLWPVGLWPIPISMHLEQIHGGRLQSQDSGNYIVMAIIVMDLYSYGCRLQSQDTANYIVTAIIVMAVIYQTKLPWCPDAWAQGCTDWVSSPVRPIPPAFGSRGLGPSLYFRVLARSYFLGSWPITFFRVLARSYF